MPSKRIVIGALSVATFLAAPLAYGVAVTASSWAGAYAPAPRPVAPESPPVPAYDPQRPSAIVLVSESGSQVTDVLAPYEVIARTGAFNLYVVAATHAPVPLGGGLELVPHLTMAEFDTLVGTGPDLVVVPAMPAAGTPALAAVRDWLRQRGPNTVVVGVCDGAQVLADAGLLDGRSATSNWSTLDGNASRWPQVAWVGGERFVDAGSVVTTAGVTSGINGTLHVLGRFVRADVVSRVATAIAYPDARLEGSPSIPRNRLHITDVLLLGLHTAYDWRRPTVAVALEAGVGEIEVASVFDVLASRRAPIARTFSIGPSATTPVVTAHGVALLPTAGWSDAESDAQALLVPGAAVARTRDASADAWARRRGLEAVYVHARPPAATAEFAFDAPMRMIARDESVASASFIAKALEYPIGHLDLDGPAWPLHLLLGPVALGAVAASAVALVARFVRAIGRVRHHITLSQEFDDVPAPNDVRVA